VRAEIAAVPRTGKPLPFSDDWDAAWDAALVAWMGVANLENRTAAAGWIDPVVLETLRVEG
jgi:hypothetical protein